MSSPEELELRVPEAPGRVRLDAWIARHCPDLSRARIQQGLREGWVRVNGESPRPSVTLRGGELIRIHAPPAAPSVPLPEEIALDVLYEDEVLLLINKPPGLVVHPAPGNPVGTVANALLHRFPALARDGSDRPGIVHRLDADTSGVLLCGKTPEMVLALQAQFKARHTEKTYRSLHRGLPAWDRQTVDQPIGRSEHDRKKMCCGGTGARDARSEFHCLQRFPAHEACDMEVRIETGRTHQIRVHAAFLHLPVLGDALYGGRRTQLPSPFPRVPRQMLHAFRLSFLHPLRKVRLDVEAPLPSDLLDLRNRLQLP